MRGSSKKLKMSDRTTGKLFNEGRRSESSKLVIDNYHLLKDLCSGSAAKIAISNSCSTIEDEEEYSFDENGNENNNENNEDNVNLDGGESEESLVDRDGKRTDSSKAPTHITEIKVTGKFVDNKRKLLEKNLSASQRDQVYFNLANEELRLKQNMVHELTESSKESNKAYMQISESIASVGKSIGDSLAALTFALSGSQQREGTANLNQNSNPMYSNFFQGMNYRTPVQNQFIPNIHQAPESNQGSHSSTFSRSPASPIAQSLYQKNDNYRNNIAKGENVKLIIICNFNIFGSGTEFVVTGYKLEQ